MGIEIIRLGNKRNQIEGQAPAKELAPLTFQAHNLPNPPMSVWLMSMPPFQPVFPWWEYSVGMETDIQTLHEVWNISNPQALFDCLFFAGLRKLTGSNFYAIFPGYVRAHSWSKLKESDHATFLRGQACIYHLEGAFKTGLSINWVPFWQPQSLVKDPSFSSLWRLFVHGRTEDLTNNLSFFSLSDPRLLPEVVNLLVEEDERRSEKLAQIVDWYGLFTSPVSDKCGTCAVVYTKNQMMMAMFSQLQKQFSPLIEQLRQALTQEPTPRTVLRFLSRQVAL